MKITNKKNERINKVIKEDIDNFTDNVLYITKRKIKYGSMYENHEKKHETIYNKRRSFDSRTIKYFKGMFCANNYGLRNDDSIILELLSKNKGKRTIGNIVLNEFESIEGFIENNHEKTKELLKLMNTSFKASYIYENKEYTNKILTNYNQIDMNSAYSYMMVSSKMPISHYKTFYSKKDYNEHILENNINLENYIIVFTQDDEYTKKVVNFECIEGLKIIEINIFNAKEIGKNFVKKWFNLKEIPKYRKLAKDVLNVAVGAIHKYRQNMISRYIWYLQYKTIKIIKEHIDCEYGDVVRVHTDCIGFISKCKDISEKLKNDNKIRIGNKIGYFKIEYLKRNVFIITAGQYQIKGENPKLSGLNYGDDGYIHFENGEKFNSKKFPAVKIGDKIVCYIKDEKIIKEIKGGYEEF
jgi:hypothetical protein